MCLRRRLPRGVFRGSIARHWDSLSTLRSEGCSSPRKTRFRPLAKLCRAGFVNPQGRDKRFPCSSHFLLSRAFLTQRHPPLELSTRGSLVPRKSRASGHFTHTQGAWPTLPEGGCLTFRGHSRAAVPDESRRAHHAIHSSSPLDDPKSEEKKGRRWGLAGVSQGSRRGLAGVSLGSRRGLAGVSLGSRWGLAGPGRPGWLPTQAPH